MFARGLVSFGAVCAVLATAALGPVGGAGAARTCTAEDLEGTRAPAMLRDHGLDTQDGPLVSGTRYRVIVVQELAIGDRGRPVEGSIRIDAPNGPALELTSEDGRPAYDFTPAREGTVRLVVSWDEEIGSSGSGDICSASQTFDLPVLDPTPPDITGRFSPGPRTFGSSFLLRLRGKEPQDPGKISVVLRARRGTTRPPAPRGRALGRFTFTPLGSGRFETASRTRELRRTFYAATRGSGIEIYPYPNIPFGRPLLFSFSVEVRQNGRRIGGMRSGANCRRIQYRSRSAVKCRPVGLKQQP